MSYQPYIPNNNQGTKQQSQPSKNTTGTPPYGQRPAASSPSTYGAPSPVYAPVGGGATSAPPYNPYAASRPTAAHPPAVASPLNAYGSRPTPSTIPAAPLPATSGPYGPRPTGPTTVASPPSTYDPYANLPAAAPPAPTSNLQGLPDFSQALDVPPPTSHAMAPPAAAAYGPATAAKRVGGDEVPIATAYPVGTSAGGLPSHHLGATAANSAVYQGGPTGGLISEGNPVKCHKIDYEIKGHEMQLVEIELDPGEVVIGEAGAMMFMEDGIKFEAKFGDGSNPKQGFWKNLLAAGGRLMTGESLFITHFTNESHGKSRVAFAAPYPGNIIPLNLATLPGNAVICERGAFLCAASGTKLSMTFNKKIGAGLFGGEGFILQRLDGDGMAFMHAGGTIIKRELRGERIRMDTGCLVAFTEGITFDIMLVPGLKSMFFGGEGLFLATLQGTGTVWMQSLPFSRMADRIIQSAPSAGGRRVGEGSALTGRLGDTLNGDGGGFKLF